MKSCKSCRLSLDAAAAMQSFHNLEKLLMFEGFAPQTIHDVAISLSPMCDKCLNDWAKELRSN
jgi:hypothetical protein